MGWNNIKIKNDISKIFKKDEKKDFYFVHSYCCLKSSDALAETEHGRNFISALEKDNIFAVQFHPEKSQAEGLKLYKNFLDWSV